jgi:hypothetical protein
VKLIQKGITRITVSASELVGMIEAACGERPLGVATLLLTREDSGDLLHQLMPGEVITISWVEDQREENRDGDRARNH